MKNVICTFLMIVLISGLCAQNKGYKKGYLIFEGNKTQEGYIKYSAGSWSVWKSKPGKVRFKFNPESKPIKAKDDVKGFVIDSDSFIVKRNIYVNDLAPVFERDFVKVIEVGRINLYLHQCSSTTNTGAGVGPVTFNVTNGHGTWILRKGTRELIINKMKRQKESLVRLISDNKELASQVEQSKPAEIDIEEIVKKYNNSSG